MIPGDAEWRAFVLSETLRPVREFRADTAVTTAAVEPVDELAGARRRQLLCAAMDGPADVDIKKAI